MSATQQVTHFFESILVRALRALCPILLFLIAAVKIGQRIEYAAFRTRLESVLVLYPPWAFTAFWILVVAVVVLLVLVALRTAGSGNLLVLKTNSGFPLKIREGAISRFVHDRLESLPFIRTSRISARAVGGALEVHGRIWVSCCEKIDDLHNQVCERIVEDTKRALGITKVLTPKIVFEDMEAGAAGGDNRTGAGRVDIFPKSDASSELSKTGNEEIVPWRMAGGGGEGTAQTQEEGKRNDV